VAGFSPPWEGERARIAARRWVRCTDVQPADEPTYTHGDICIVPFEVGHADAYRALVTDTLREFGFEPDPTIDPDLDEPAAVYTALWVALSDGEVVGSVALRDLGDGALELKRMYLRSGVRGRGLGKRLLAIALDHARATGAHLVRLDTSERMETARHLYEAHGFARVPGYAPRQGQKRLLYELRL
jgi:GNAT superfamily N-acetyltransferase